jgi:inhibitor of the pro-sigma K processing machinery
LKTNILWGILIISTAFLFIILLKNRRSMQWIGYAMLNLVVAAVLLYFANWIGASYGLHIPLNGPTVATVGILGVPGLLLLTLLKLTIVV